MTHLALILTLLPGAALAGYGRPVPKAQSATAEFWFLAASIALVVALAVVQRLVARRRRNGF
ncbi:protein NnrT [Rhodovulum euryhalinum]|uniref:Protein NnrT n=1 Tax=Rhodovulum euryhalinum TaxID=35805 RepID=A0A4R2K8A9_9RHOB|nr:protein NnrT [Rhodovulum euryhalinum]TCO68844.1 hypothetical protein EV655_12222 [Rhodovulum euryhalinum]